MYGVDLILSSLGTNTSILTHLSSEIFLSTTIRIIFILYDQPSRDLATAFLTTPTSSHHEWYTINVNTGFPRLAVEYEQSISDQNLIIAVFDDWEQWKIEYYKVLMGPGHKRQWQKYHRLSGMFDTQEHANILFVSNDENLETSVIYQRLESLHRKELFYFKAVLLHLSASAVNCYTLKNRFDNIHQLIFIEFSNNRSIFEQLFWNRYKQMDKDKLVVSAQMDYPYLFVGKRRSKEMPGQYEYGVGGSFVHTTGIMAEYLNATHHLLIHDFGIYKYNKKISQFNLTTAKNALLVGSSYDPLVPASRLNQ